MWPLWAWAGSLTCWRADELEASFGQPDCVELCWHKGAVSRLLSGLFLPACLLCFACPVRLRLRLSPASFAFAGSQGRASVALLCSSHFLPIKNAFGPRTASARTPTRNAARSRLGERASRLGHAIPAHAPSETLSALPAEPSLPTNALPRLQPTGCVTWNLSASGLLPSQCRIPRHATRPA